MQREKSSIKLNHDQQTNISLTNLAKKYIYIYFFNNIKLNVVGGCQLVEDVPLS